MFCLANIQENTKIFTFFKKEQYFVHLRDKKYEIISNMEQYKNQMSKKYELLIKEQNRKRK